MEPGHFDVASNVTSWDTTSGMNAMLVSIFPNDLAWSPTNVTIRLEASPVSWSSFEDNFGKIAQPEAAVPAFQVDSALALSAGALALFTASVY